MNKKILRLAGPNIISNITVPLLGMVDLAIVGHLGGGELLGGVAIGTAMFNLLYWNFGFLRMGTSGFTSQAYGRRDFADSFRTLFRAVIVALSIAGLILVLQIPLERGILGLMDGSQRVESLAAEYFYVRVWAAPATLSMYAFNGWFIGMQNAKTPMYIAIFVNIVHIAASYYFAVTMGMGLPGVALGTAISQWTGLVTAAIIVWKFYGKLCRREYFSGLFHKADLVKFFRVNSDIFIRTVCLVVVFTFFTSASSSMGDTVLAANTLMLQLFTLFSYIMDGFAFSGEALAGRYFGAKNTTLLRKAVRGVFVWGAVISVIFTVVYALFGQSILSLFSDDQSVIAATAESIVWGVVIPLVSFSAFLMDGILVGMSQAKLMRNTMIVSSVGFFAIYYSLVGSIGNNALWLAFTVYLGVRGILQIFGSYKFFSTKPLK